MATQTPSPKVSPIHAQDGWINLADRWALIWRGRQVASIHSIPGGARAVVDMGKMWEVEESHAQSAEEAKRYVERKAAAILLPGIALDQVANLLESRVDLRPLPLVQGLPPGFRWIKPALTAKRATVVAFGDQWVAAIHQSSRSAPLEAILALHLDCAPGQRPVRTCTSLEQGKRGLELWVGRHQGRIVREIQQGNRLRNAGETLRRMNLPPAGH